MIDDKVDEVPIQTLCRRHNYEFLYKQDVYCSKPEENCLYRSDKKTIPCSYYSCMMMEKRSLWVFEK